MWQKTGTEELLKEYINSIVKNHQDKIIGLSEIYVNIIPPMTCPRCEGAIMPYNQLIKKGTSDSAFIVNVLLYEKPKALSQYILKQNFPGDVLYIDDSDRILKIFTFNNDNVSVPFVTKIAIKEGRLISANSILGINLSHELVKGIIRKQEFEPLHHIERKSKDITASSNALTQQRKEDIFFKNFILYPKDSCIIPSADTLPKIHHFHVNITKDKLLIDNFLTNSFLLYSRKDKQWSVPLTLSPTPEEDVMYLGKGVDTSLIYLYYKHANVFVSMYLNASFTQSNVYIMVSLPEVTRGEENPSEFEYYNKPLCLIKNEDGKLVHSYDLSNIGEPEKLTKEGYIVSHYGAFYFEEDNLFVLKIHKGWPVSGTNYLPQKDDTIRNPFLPEFYNQKSTLMFYNYSTHSYTLTAPLDSLYEKYKLGYYFSSPKVKKYNNAYYIVDRHIGKIKCLSKDLSSATVIFDLFKIDTSIKQMQLSEDLGYLDSYNSFFSRRVEDFLIYDDNNCYAIISDSAHHYLLEAKRNKISTESCFPKTINGLELTKLQFGYDEQQNSVIYGLYQNNQRALIYTFNF
jgi:hypothetical protein